MRDWNALMVHGAGGGAWEWNAWRAVLKAHGIAVQAPDLQPGHAGLAQTGLQEYANQVSAALQRMPRPRTIIGASLGGLLAAMNAGQADALVLVNPLPPVPWHLQLDEREWGEVVRWRLEARLHSTRGAMEDADDVAAMYAFRRWRDESGAVLMQAHAGIHLRRPACPALFIGSASDADVGPELLRRWSQAWEAGHMETLATSHVGPLLGRHASAIAAQAVAWLNRLDASA